MHYKIKNNIFTYSLLMPWIIIFLVFWAYPLIYSLVLSFTEYKTLSNEMTFIGFDNYSKLVGDGHFWNALSNTFIFTFGTVPITTMLAILLATLINSKAIRLKGLFKSAMFMPSITSLVVLSLIFTNLYMKEGYINALLQFSGLPFPDKGFLLDETYSLASIMFMDIWIAVGYYMVLFLAGMQAIPKDLYEEAELSGASSFQKLFKITIPLLKPTILFVLIINTIKSFQVFIEIYVMTKGGPLGSTMTVVYYIFDNAFNRADMMGYASAVAYVLFIILIIFSFLQMRLLRER